MSRRWGEDIATVERIADRLHVVATVAQGHAQNLFRQGDTRSGFAGVAAGVFGQGGGEYAVVRPEEAPSGRPQRDGAPPRAYLRVHHGQMDGAGREIRASRLQQEGSLLYALGPHRVA